LPASGEPEPTKTEMGLCFLASGALSLQDTLLASNSGKNFSTTGGNFTSKGHNLSDDSSTNSFFTGSHDLSNTPAGLAGCRPTAAGHRPMPCCWAAWRPVEETPSGQPSISADFPGSRILPTSAPSDTRAVLRKRPGRPHSAIGNGPVWTPWTVRWGLENRHQVPLLEPWSTKDISASTPTVHKKTSRGGECSAGVPG
jgi:hypothetical protein